MSAKHQFVTLQINDIEIIQQLMQAWKATQRDPIVAYHRVLETPTDLAGTSDDVLLLEFASDSARRSSTDDRLLLVDIYLQGTGPEDTQWFRRVLWGRRLMTHQDILHLLCAGELCSDAAQRCLLHHNSVLWPSHDAARRTLESGDYLRLRIQSLEDSPACWLMEQIRVQENAEAQRFIFRASPLSDPSSGASEADSGQGVQVEPDEIEERSESETSGRPSRSRSRGRDDSVSLIQRSASTLRAPENIQTLKHPAESDRPPQSAVRRTGCRTAFQDITNPPFGTPTPKEDVLTAGVWNRLLWLHGHTPGPGFLWFWMSCSDKLFVCTHSQECSKFRMQ